MSRLDVDRLVAIDVHVHFDSAQLCEHAIASGITTMLGGSLGPITVGIDCGGAWNVGRMLQAAEEWPINFGFLGRGIIDNVAHMGGLLSGAALASVISYKRPGRPTGVKIAWRVMQIAALLLVLVCFYLAARHAG